ncbi:Rho GTPase-activating protein 31 [Merluccius polli]|uniref:Rho GTPase-activating protein 31 n=1 Tax=Merluccius polli TaxID=89951 RepID=A0AA47PCU2_MERPO|nr:Rho GTPase-activating protein 31 [Merluccius polli]
MTGYTDRSWTGALIVIQNSGLQSLDRKLCTLGAFRKAEQPSRQKCPGGRGGCEKEKEVCVERGNEEEEITRPRLERGGGGVSWTSKRIHMKNKASKLKSKKKGSDNVFGCDLTEHLQSSAEDGKLFLLKALSPRLRVSLGVSCESAVLNKVTRGRLGCFSVQNQNLAMLACLNDNSFKKLRFPPGTEEPVCVEGLLGLAVLKKCAEFIEHHGVVDGIYRLSGVTSNIQRLRQEFSSDSCPDLTKEVYLQDIHCVGSLCKLYFRELPNPLLTYELYSQFTEAASVQGPQEKLDHIQRVIKELPVSHFSQYQHSECKTFITHFVFLSSSGPWSTLTKHLSHLATLSSQTNMHTRNLALVWAPNLLRCKDIDASACSGDQAFQEVRVQQAVVEFILSHTEQIFNHGTGLCKAKEGLSFACGEKYATLPLSGGQGGPMKLMSLEEAQARSLGPNHPVHRERQRENSLPDTSTATLYHTVLDISDSKRKFSGKSKKWKSIFNLGRSVNESKGKLNRNGSVFIRGPNTDKAALRPARSMDSLCSLQIGKILKNVSNQRTILMVELFFYAVDDDRTGSPPSGASSPDAKSRTLGSDSLYDLREEDQRWDFKGKTTPTSGTKGGHSSPATNQREAAGSSSSSSQPQKTLPEQLKVFKGDDLAGFKPTSPKNRRMLYTGSAHHHSASKPSFPGSLFPLESSSPRHQRKAVNISEPFAVSVPLRVSAVISSNSTPCGAHVKEKTGATAGGIRPGLGEGSSISGSSHSNSSSSSSSLLQLEIDGRGRQTGDVPERATSELTSADPNERAAQDGGGEKGLSTLECSGEHLTSSPGKLDQGSSPSVQELWLDLHHELKITEPELDLLDKTFKPIFCPEGSDNISSKSSSQSSSEDLKTKSGRGGQSQRSSSSPTLSVFHGGPKASTVALTNLLTSSGPNRVRKLASESDILLPFYQNMDFAVGDKKLNPFPCATSKDEKERKLHRASMVKSTSLDTSTDFKHWQVLSGNKSLDFTQANLVEKQVPPVDDTGNGRFLEEASKDGVEIETYENHKPSEEAGQEPLAEVQTAATSSKGLVDRPKTSSGGRKEHRSEVQKAATSFKHAADRPRTSSEGGQKPPVQIPRAGISSIRLEDRPKTLVFHHLDEDEAGHSEELDQVESWDELSSGSRQWVTSPLHTPEIEDLLRDHLLLALPSSTLSSPDGGEGGGGGEGGEGGGEGTSSHPLDMNKPAPASDATPSGSHVSQGRGSAEEPKEPKAPRFQHLLPRTNGSSSHNAAPPPPPQTAKCCPPIKPKNNSNANDNPPSQRFRRQTSQEACPSHARKDEGPATKHARPCSLNLDLVGRRCIRDISNQPQSRSVQAPCQQGPPPRRSVDNGSEALELFLNNSHAPLRRNSAPVSVTSVRTAFMIKTSQAKAVPVVPPKVQYTQIPHSRQDNDVRGAAREQENQNPKRRNAQEQTPAPAPPAAQTTTATTTVTTTAALKKKEELENKKPVLRHQKHESLQEAKNGPAPDPEPQVTMRKPAAATAAAAAPHRRRRGRLPGLPAAQPPQHPPEALLQEPAEAPDPPFPIMDYPPLDDSKLALAPKRSLNDATSLARREEAPAGVNLRKTPAEGKGLQSKMTIPKSGQRLETSTSCFYQPQRRSMIFESRTQRQIE